jgi:hypothetical protein
MRETELVQQAAAGVIEISQLECGENCPNVSHEVSFRHHDVCNCRVRRYIQYPRDMKYETCHYCE